jgi:coenzyme PQQ precursor peptide PqqA
MRRQSPATHSCSSGCSHRACTELDARQAWLHNCFGLHKLLEDAMQEWHKPEVTEQEVGLEVTSYSPAEV